jgi:outer membrane autotransporter protein
MTTLLAAPALGASYTVDSLDDGDVDDVGTFRWAIEQANNNAGMDTINFDAVLLAEADSDFVIQIELDSALQTISEELEIVAPIVDEGLPTHQEYFIDIVRDPSAGDEILVTETITLRNVELRSNALIFNGGTNSDPVGTIDVVYDIGDFSHDIFWVLSDRDEDRNLDVEEPGRIVKTGQGELGLLPSQGAFGEYTGPTLLVDGVIRTDTRSLTGDIQLCASTGAGDDYDSEDCDSALLVFEMPSTTIDTELDRGGVPTDGTYDGVISSTAGSAARVVKTGIGTLTLTGANTYDGDTYIMQGELRSDHDSIPAISDSGSDIYICPGVASITKPDFANPLVTNDDIDCDSVDPAVLTLDISEDTIFAASLYGQGDLNKEGGAEFTLGDQSTFGGTVTVREGQLNVDDDLGTAGASTTEVEVRINDGAELNDTGTIYGDVDVRDGGEMFGDGTVEGDTRIRSGGLVTGTLTLNGDVDVDGRLVVGGGGSVTGNVDVGDGGTALGSGDINGDVAVESGGEIRGDLDINGDLALSGRLDLTLVDMNADSATFADGSRIEINPEINGGDPGSLFVVGTLALRGGAVDVRFNNIDLADLPEGRFLVASATGALDGTLTGGQNGDGVLSEFAIFDVDLEYGATACAGGGANEVCLDIAFDPVLSDDADTRNQRAIAGALDAAYTCAQDPGSPECQIDQDTADDFLDLYGNFAVPIDEVPDILDRLSGTDYAAVADVRSSAVSRFNRTVSRRFDLELLGVEAKPAANDEGEVALPGVSLGGVRWLALGGGARNYDDRRSQRMPWRRKKPREPMPINRHAGAGGFTAWLDMHGVMGELDGDENASDVDYHIYGPLVGLDYGITENIALGVTLGYTRNELETPGNRSRSTGDSYQGGVYFGALFEEFYVTGAFRYAYSDFETRRRIRFGNVRRTARADFDTNDISGFIEAAYKLPFPDFVPIPDNVAVQPFVSASYSNLDQGSFRESNAGSLNLDIDSQKLDSLHTNVGVRLALFGRDDENRYMLPQLRVSYEREWLDPDRPLDASLPAAGTGGEFEIDGVELPKDRAVIGVTSEAGVTDTINLFVDYDLRVAPDLLEHSLAFGVRALF